MTNRRLVVASLLAAQGLAGVSLAHAASADAGPGFVTGWKASNGTDMLASGVLGRDVSLLGGVAHRVGDTLANSLLGSASASLTQVEAQQLYVQRGIEADYVLSGGNALLAALSGNSAAVINDGSGAAVLPVTASVLTPPKVVAPTANPAPSPTPSSGTANQGGSGGVGSGEPTTVPAPGAASEAQPGIAGTSNPAADSGVIVDAGDAGDAGDGEDGAGPAPLALPAELINDVPDPAASVGAELALPVVSAQVPEPGALALLLAGVAGWTASTRRRRRRD